MLDRKIFQCEYCYKRKSFNKTRMKLHEEKCFMNPATKSCATCLWFSPLVTIENRYPIKCYLGMLMKVRKSNRLNLKTQCDKWLNKEVYFDNETCENQDEMERKLLSGEENYFKDLQMVRQCIEVEDY